MSSQVIAIVGGSGNQGSGLVKKILEDPLKRYKARILTRDVSKVQALVDKGCEAVAADLESEASVTAAFTGAHGVFAVTPYGGHPAQETETAKRIARAAKAANVKHVVWSTLEDTRLWMDLDDPSMPTLHEKYKVPHFDAKGEADPYFTSIGVPTTFLLTSFYFENFTTYFGLRKQPDGTYLLALPLGDKPLSGIAVEDIGITAFSLFNVGPRKTAGKYFGVAGEHLTGDQYAEKMGRALKITVKYAPIPFDVFRTFPFPGAKEFGNMFQFYNNFAPFFIAPRNVEAARLLNGSIQSFDDWLANNASKIKIE